MLLQIGVGSELYPTLAGPIVLLAAAISMELNSRAIPCPQRSRHWTYRPLTESRSYAAISSSRRGMVAVRPRSRGAFAMLPSAWANASDPAHDSPIAPPGCDPRVPTT